MAEEDKKYLQLAIVQARKSVEAGGFPAGAVIVKNGLVVSEGISTGFINYDPSGHADISAIKQACYKLKSANLQGASLYVSLESCNMCFSAAYWAGVSRILFACKKIPEMAAKFYYEGTIDNQLLNQANNRHMELIHASDLELESMQVIQEWEKTGGINKKV